MLWVDKYRPTSLDKLDYHHEQAAQLKRMASTGEIPHMLFYGPSGAGKKTRILSLLRELFGPGVEKMKLEHRSFKTPSNRAVDVTTVASSYHIEINPGDAGIYDRYVVQEVVKEIASSSPLMSRSADGSLLLGGGSSAAAGSGSGGDSARPMYKVVLLTEVDRLTKEAQHALRRTMEKYVSSCRLILCCESPSRVISPVRSRCLGIRVPAPSQFEVMTVLETICRKEGLTLPKQLAAKVARVSERNLRRAVLTLEACKAQQYPFDPQQVVARMDWDRFCEGLAREIEADQSPATFVRCRKKLADLLVNCIPSDVIFKTLLGHLLRGPTVTDGLRHELVSWGAHFERKMKLGQKEIFYLEAFVARTMAVLKQFQLEHQAAQRPGSASHGAAAAGAGGGVVVLE